MYLAKRYYFYYCSPEQAAKKECLLLSGVLYSFIYFIPYVAFHFATQMQHGSGKQWKLLSFQRLHLYNQWKSTGCCFVCCTHGRHWPAEHANHVAIKQTRTAFTSSTVDPEGVQKCSCACVSVHKVVPSSCQLINFPWQTHCHSVFSVNLNVGVHNAKKPYLKKNKQILDCSRLKNCLYAIKDWRWAGFHILLFCFDQKWVCRIVEFWQEQSCI